MSLCESVCVRERGRERERTRENSTLSHWSNGLNSDLLPARYRIQEFRDIERVSGCVCERERERPGGNSTLPHWSNGLNSDFLPGRYLMVCIFDGCSFHCAHIWSKSGISIC